MNSVSVCILSACALVCAGCLVGRHDDAGTSLVLNHDDGGSVLFEGNTRLKNRIQVTAVTYDKTPSGLNRVNVQLTSQDHHKLLLQYRISWYNSEGMEIDADTRTYRPLTLQGLDSVTVTGVANHPSAVKSRIRIREQRSMDGYRE